MCLVHERFGMESMMGVHFVHQIFHSECWRAAFALFLISFTDVICRNLVMLGTHKSMTMKQHNYNIPSGIPSGKQAWHGMNALREYFLINISR